MTPLDWYPRPQPDTGLGFHDSSSVGGNPPDIEKHAAALAASGLRWYKLLAADESKVGRAATYERHGIKVVLRLWAPDPFPRWRPDPGHLRAYRAVGVDYFELGNEPNLGGSVEWAGGVMPGPGAFGEQVGRFWLEGAARVKAEGGIPLFPAMTPGGSYDHRLALADVFDYLARVGGLSSFDGAGVAIHPRPMTFPPDHPATEHATVTFNEYQWIAGLLRARLGWVPPLFATEHGYARKDSTNTGFPPMTDQTWASYNRTLFERMNPAHSQAVEPYLFCLLYWLEAAAGTWQSDEASPGWWPDTSTPWAREIAAISAGWHRTTDDSPPPPPPSPPEPPAPPPPPPPEPAMFEAWLREQGAAAAVVPVTPGFALYDAILDDGLLPNGPEVRASFDARAYTLRSAEHPTDLTGPRYTYYVEVPAPGQPWRGVKRLLRGGREHPAPPSTPPAPTIIERPSPNHDARPDGESGRVSAIVLHATAGSAGASLSWLTNAASGASTHYLIAKDGRTWRLVQDTRRAWHAGTSDYLGRDDWNDFSLGIELENDNDGRDPYPAVQLATTVALLRWLVWRHGIRREWVATHGQVAIPPGRKTDPRGLDVAALLAEVYLDVVEKR